MRLLTALPLGLLLASTALFAADPPPPLDPPVVPGAQAHITVSRPKAQNSNACDVDLYVQNHSVARLAPGDSRDIPVPSGLIALGVISVGSALCVQAAETVHIQSVELKPGETRHYLVSSDKGSVFLSPQP